MEEDPYVGYPEDFICFYFNRWKWKFYRWISIFKFLKITYKVVGSFIYESRVFSLEFTFTVNSSNIVIDFDSSQPAIFYTDVDNYLITLLPAQSSFIFLTLNNLNDNYINVSPNFISNGFGISVEEIRLKLNMYTDTIDSNMYNFINIYESKVGFIFNLQFNPTVTASFLLDNTFILTNSGEKNIKEINIGEIIICNYEGKTFIVKNILITNCVKIYLPIKINKRTLAEKSELYLTLCHAVY